MDVEARRKFCGLLMFDVPSVSTKSSSRNSDIIINNMSTRDDLPYESSRVIDHQFINDGYSDFSTSSHALAAGAAAGADMNQEGPDSNIGGDSKQKRTPRPPNAFILYRREKQPAIIASQRSLTNAEVSRTISEMWRKEPEEIRLEWERYADRKKLEHMQTYPNYVYRPNKNKSKLDKRRQQRRQTKDSTNASNNNSPVENKATNGSNGPVRRRSTKNNSKPPTKLDMPSNNGMVGFNMQQSMNQSANTSNSSYTTMLQSPEIPMLTAHYTDNPEEFQSQLTPVTPVTPITPPEHDYKIQNDLLRLVPVEDLTYPHHNHHHHQQGNPQFSFHQSIPGLTYNNQTVDPLDFCSVPDVEQQQRQMFAELMLYHDPNHHITPTATVPSSNPAQYYSNGTNTAALAGSHSYTEMLGFEFPNFLGGSVNHHDNGNGLDASGQYLQ